jgi:hypothetical protein
MRSSDRGPSGEATEFILYFGNRAWIDPRHLEVLEVLAGFMVGPAHGWGHVVGNNSLHYQLVCCAAGHALRHRVIDGGEWSWRFDAQVVDDFAALRQRYAANTRYRFELETLADQRSGRVRLKVVE